VIIDLHFHTEKYSSCSHIPLEEGVARAASIGLDAICLTEHDLFHGYGNLSELEKRYGIRIFSGVEVFSAQGDILCFGLDQIPPKGIDAVELVARLAEQGGASIAAHPFRDNNRGVRDLIVSLSGLTAVEAWNGNTSVENNLKALNMAASRDIPVVGASDCHRLDRIGCYATEFPGNIKTDRDLVDALRSGEFLPLRFDEKSCTYKVVSLSD